MIHKIAVRWLEEGGAGRGGDRIDGIRQFLLVQLEIQPKRRERVVGTVGALNSFFCEVSTPRALVRRFTKNRETA